MAKGKIIETSEEVEVNKTDKAEEKKVKVKKTKKPNEKGALKRKVAETISELKKVTWPTFGTIAKKTGIVLAFVALSLVILVIIDIVLKFLTGLLY